MKLSLLTYLLGKDMTRASMASSCGRRGATSTASNWSYRRVNGQT